MAHPVPRRTRVLAVDPVDPDAAVIREAERVLREGGLVAFPTETVYGLGADALNPDAVAGIFAAKERPADDPLIVHVAEPHEVDRVVEHVPEVARHLMERFWPGPLTLVLPRRSNVPLSVTAGGPTVAVRCPASEVARALIAAAGAPVAAPSANRFAHTSPTLAAHVLADLDGRIDLVLDGGPTRVGVESTVLDVSGERPILLRPGGVAIERIEAEIGPVGRRWAGRSGAADGAGAGVAVRSPSSGDETPGGPPAPGAALPSPGLLDRHYAPSVPLHLYRGPTALARLAVDARAGLMRGTRIGFLVPDEAVTHLDEALGSVLAPALSDGSAGVVPLGAQAQPEVAAQRLYAGMRTLEAAGLDVILALDPEAAGLGRAVSDRLQRAAEEVLDG